MVAVDAVREIGARLGTGRRIELGARGWGLVVGVVVAFVLVVEAVALANGLTGPIEDLAHSYVGRARVGETTLAGLLLALVCMPARLRLPVVGIAAAIEIPWNLQRLIVGNNLTVGNGVLFTLTGTAIYAMWRLRGRDRASALKAIGLGMLLIVMSRVADVWLVLTMKLRPDVLDQYVEVADRALGSPSWVIGSLVTDNAWLSNIFSTVYVFLAVGAAIIAAFQLRNSARDGFPRHHIVRTFLLIGLIGPTVYFLFPVVGPTYAFGHELAGAGLQDVWPFQQPQIVEPVAEYFAQTVPRNCMPSLHTAWAMAIFIHGWRGGRASRIFGTVWLICTTGATLGFGYHYAVDILAGAIFTLTIEAALTRPELGWHRQRFAVVAFGAVNFATVLLITRYLPVELANSGAIGGISLVLMLAAMAVAFLSIEVGGAPAAEDDDHHPGGGPGGPVRRRVSAGLDQGRESVNRNGDALVGAVRGWWHRWDRRSPGSVSDAGHAR